MYRALGKSMIEIYREEQLMQKFYYFLSETEQLGEKKQKGSTEESCEKVAANEGLHQCYLKIAPKFVVWLKFNS